MAERPRKKRARPDIIIEILQSAEDGAKKTHIMRKANLSFSMLKKYLNALKNGGFITEKNGIWKTTKEGLHVIEACKICHRLLETA